MNRVLPSIATPCARVTARMEDRRTGAAPDTSYRRTPDPSVATAHTFPATASPSTQLPAATGAPATGAAGLVTSSCRRFVPAPTYTLLPTARTALTQEEPNAWVAARTGLSGLVRS